MAKIANRENRDFAIWPKIGFWGFESPNFSLLGPSFNMLCILSLVLRKISLEVFANNFGGHFGPKTGFSGYAPIYGNGPALGAPMWVWGPNWFQSLGIFENAAPKIFQNRYHQKLYIFKSKILLGTHRNKPEVKTLKNLGEDIIDF